MPSVRSACGPTPPSRPRSWHTSAHERALPARRRLPAQPPIVTDDAFLAEPHRFYVLATPSAHLRDTLRRVGPSLHPDAAVLSVVKGIEEGTHLRMSEVAAQELPGRRIAALSGPNLAREIAAGKPAGSVVASDDHELAAELASVLSSDRFRVYTNPDLVGVELAGALKNVVALAAGTVDGLGFGDSAKAGIITRGLAEMTRLGVAAGAQPLTFAGLAGVGDLIATCMSPLSRNRMAGELIASGVPWPEAGERLTASRRAWPRSPARWSLPRSMASSCRSPTRCAPWCSTTSRRWPPSPSSCAQHEGRARARNPRLMARPLRFGISVVPYADNHAGIVEQVRAADEGGLDLVGIQDHPYQRRYLDTYSLIADLLARTERLRFFPDVTSLAMRDPPMIAKAAASMDVMSGGRFELGLGAGNFWTAVAGMGRPKRTNREAFAGLEEAIADHPRALDVGPEKRVVRGPGPCSGARATPPVRRPRTGSASGSASTGPVA